MAFESIMALLQPAAAAGAGTAAVASAAPLALVPTSIGATAATAGIVPTATSLAGAHSAFALGAGLGTASASGTLAATLAAGLKGSTAFLKEWGPAGIGLVGAGTSASGSAALARSQAKALEFQAGMYAAEAAEAARIGAEGEQRLRREGSRLAGAQRAALSASGVQVGRGTALLLQDNLSDEIEREVATVRAGRASDVSRMYSLSRVRGLEAGGVRTASRYGSVSSLLEGGAKFGLRLTNPTGA